MPQANGYLIIFINILTSYAAINGLDFAPTMIKIYGIFSALNAVLFVLNPKGAASTWKFANPDASLLSLTRMQGTVLATHAVACLAQSFYPDTSALELVAYGATALGITSLPVLADLKGLGMETPFQVYVGYLACFFGVAY